MFDAIFDSATWARVPFHFWTGVFFVFGCIVGSFLNVCIHRLPLEQSIISPPSHCPHCKYSIPAFLNVPLLTWLYLGGKCKNCGAPISIRYFLVELLTGLLFAACWLAYGHVSSLVTLVYCLFLAGLVVGTFTDFEHLMIPDEITLGGVVVGLLASLLIPQLHGEASWIGGLLQSAIGICVGSGVLYLIVRIGKLFLGRQRVELPEGSRVIFTETALYLPDEEIAYGELFYRDTDAVVMDAQKVELADRCYWNVKVRLCLLKKSLEIGDETIDPETVAYLEAAGTEIVLPREAMGLGDVKLIAAIGAFLGWSAVVFTLAASSMIGAVIGLALRAVRGREQAARLPYVPFLAIAAAAWIFLPAAIREHWTENLVFMWRSFVWGFSGG